MSDSVRPRRRQPTRLPCPWDAPGKNTAVGCHFLLQRMKVKSQSEVAQSCPTFCDPMDCSPPDSSIHGILQARILEWVAISFSRDSSQPGIEPTSPAMQETQVLSLCQENPLKKEMATHCSILAWRIPWMEEPGGLQSMRSHRAGHN